MKFLKKISDIFFYLLKLLRIIDEHVSYRNKLIKDAIQSQNDALNIHASVSTTDNKGTIIYANDTFCKNSGYEIEEILGQNHRILNSGHHPKEFWECLYKHISNGTPWHGVVKSKKKNGDFYWNDTTIYPVLDSDGKPYLFTAIRTEVTEIKNDC